MVRDICTRRNVLLITDEVVTGFGRTGKMFAVQHWGIQPDMMSMAKGITSAYLPFGAVGMAEGMYEGLKTPGTPLFHLYTYSGHPACCAVAVKNMEILVEERLADNAARVGQYLLGRMQELEELPHVTAVDGLGLTLGFEVVADKATKAPFDPALKVGDRLVAQARERGLLFRMFGERLGLTPPLIITTEEVDRVVGILRPLLEALSPA
jgi:adenosylmethionine-8-amino-7-oxononanoate aminotransferase